MDFDKIIADKRTELIDRKEKISLAELKEQVLSLPKCHSWLRFEWHSHEK